MRRIYKAAVANGNAVMLDGKSLRTPAGNVCILPTNTLAATVAAEWDAQGDMVKPATMPITQLVMTALDRIPAVRALIEEDVLRYLTTELICHYADVPAVAAYQRTQWQPLHDWLKEKFGVILPVTTALVPLPESDAAWAALHVAAYDDWRLCALQQAVNVCGSFVIGVALVEGAVDAHVALAAAEAEADFQAEKWGRDDESAARRNGVLSELVAVQQFIELLNR